MFKHRSQNWLETQFRYRPFLLLRPHSGELYVELSVLPGSHLEAATTTKFRFLGKQSDSLRRTTVAGGTGEKNAASEIPNLAAREGCMHALAHTHVVTFLSLWGLS